MIQIPHPSWADALESDRLGESLAAMVIRDKFTESLKMCILATRSIDARLTDSSSIHLHLGMSDYLIGIQLQKI